MKIPGPDHPITIAANPKRVRVTFAGKVIADTTRALTLSEASYPAVQYIPRQDVDMTALSRTTHASHCPYKGEAEYWSLRSDRAIDDIAWSYRTPLHESQKIAGLISFYPDKVALYVDGVEQT